MGLAEYINKSDRSYYGWSGIHYRYANNYEYIHCDDQKIYKIKFPVIEQKAFKGKTTYKITEKEISLTPVYYIFANNNINKCSMFRYHQNNYKECTNITGFFNLNRVHVRNLGYSSNMMSSYHDKFGGPKKHNIILCYINEFNEIENNEKILDELEKKHNHFENLEKTT